MRECRETLAISHYGRFDYATITRAPIKKPSHRTSYKLTLVPFDIHIASVAVRDDSTPCLISTLVNWHLKYKLVKFGFSHIVTGSLIVNLIDKINIKSCTLSVQSLIRPFC